VLRARWKASTEISCGEAGRVQCAGDGVAPGRETGVASITKQVGCVYLWSVRQSPSDRDIDACSHGGRRKRGHLFVSNATPTRIFFTEAAYGMTW
jgi:hypothetical protein